MARRLSGVCSDVLVNNAGIMPVSPLDDLRVDDWDEMIDISPARLRSRSSSPPILT
jgi:NADP-dependent 3-hydroxy acid dehydrogenase YdfG